jgi:hypothetical protein
MTYEEYLQYEETVLPELLRKYANFAPDIFYPQFAASFEDAYAAEHSQTNNTENNEQQRNDTTAEEPTTTPGDTVLQTEETNNSRGDSQSEEQPTEVPTGVRSSNENGTLPQSTPTEVDKEPLSEEAAQSLITSMEENAIEDPEIRLTPQTWLETFGINNSIDTPIGKVRMGENQYAKLQDKKRTSEFGMISLTLSDPDVIFVEPSKAKGEDVAERNFSYVFAKTFKRNGNKVKYYTSVTVSIDGLEISVSSHFVNPNKMLNKLMEFNREYTKETLFSNSSEMRLAEHQSDVPDLLPTQENNVSSADKDTQSSKTKQEKENKFSPTPRKDGESITDYAERVAEEHKAQRTRKAEEAKVDTNPTDAQKEAGNYKKGHIKVDGLDITIEQPKGSIRRGTDANGKQWESEMHNTYGYIRGTESADGDHIDIFLSDNPTEGKVFVVDQINKDGSFDEHKVMYGFSDMESAKRAYLSNYEEGWQGLGSITEVKKEDFKKWIDSSKRKTKPFAEYTSVKTQDDVQTKKPTEENAAPAKTQTEENNAHNSENIMHEQKNVQLQQAINAYENATKFYYQQLKEGKLDKVFESKQWKDVLRKQTELQKVLLQLNSEELKELLKQTTNEDTKKEIKGALDAVLRQEQRSIEYNAVLDKQEPITPIYKEEKKPIAVTEFVETDKKEAEIHPILTGVYHDNGYVVGTNAHILLARKEDYNKSLEGKIKNKKGWDSIKALLKDNPIWNEVVADANYSNIADNEDAVASEVLSRISGKKNAAKMEEEAQRAIDEAKGVFEKARATTILTNLKKALNSLWKWVSKNIFDVKEFSSINEVTDKVLYDLIHGTKLINDKSLIGVHNISEQKLRKVLKQGGFANPSIAVIDTDKQVHNDYGEISLILPSRKVNKSTGKNVGTYEGDAWTPMYPIIEKQMSNDGNLIMHNDINSVPNEMQSEVRNALNRWLDNGSDTDLSYLYLFQQGKAPKMATVKPKYSNEVYKSLRDIMFGVDSVYNLTKGEVKKLVELYVQTELNGDIDEYNKANERRITKYKETIESGRTNSMYYKIAERNLEEVKKYGYPLSSLKTFADDVQRDKTKQGSKNVQKTLNAASQIIKDAGLEEDFRNWVEGLNNRYQTKEVIFDGFTPTGKRRYIPNTLENVSKLMKKQGRQASTGLGVSFSNFAASVMKANGSLANIRKKKSKLTNEHKDIENFEEKWKEVYFDLAMKLQPNASTFDDYGFTRLQEAALEADPQAFLSKEYGVTLSKEDVRKLQQMVKAIQEERPAMYFETKFERPVTLNEFSKAVVPEDLSDDLQKTLRDNGIEIFTYKRGDAEDRQKATQEAAYSSDDIAFQIISNGNNEANNDSDTRFQIVGNSLSDEEKKIVETAKANDTYMKAPNGKPTNLSEKQWTQVRTKAFKKWFGDWEKAARIEKVRRSKAVVISGSEYKDKYELNRDSAKEWIKDNLRGEYTIADTEEIVSLTKVGANKVTSHGMSNKAHLQSIAAIPQLIRHAIFIEERPNEKHNNKYDSYKYYICGLKIGTTDYTVKLTIGVKSGKKYYDHALTEIEKGKLLDRINDQADKKGFTTTGDAPLQSYALSIGKDSKLLSILQTNSSKVVDENGEPMVAYHGSNNEFTKFDTARIGSSTGTSDGRGFYFTTDKDYANSFGKDGNVLSVFLNIDNPLSLKEKTITKRQLFDIIKRIDEKEVAADGEHWFISNYANYYDVGIDGAIREAAESEYPYSDNDVELVNSLISASGNFKDVVNSVYEITGKSSEIVPKENGTVHYVVTNPNQIKSATGNNGNFSTTEDDILYRTVFGGNSGYVGYSMSKRAAEAKEEGRYPKTEFKKEYHITEKSLDMLTRLGFIDNSEWHHTSMYGNKTPFYGWTEDELTDDYLKHKKEIDTLCKGFDPKTKQPLIEKVEKPQYEHEYEMPQYGEAETAANPIREWRFKQIDKYDQFTGFKGYADATEEEKKERDAYLHSLNEQMEEKIREMLAKDYPDYLAAKNALDAYNNYEEDLRKAIGEHIKEYLDIDKYSQRWREQTTTAQPTANTETLTNHAESIVQNLHLNNVEIVPDGSSLNGEQATAKGFYNKRTGKIVVVAGNHTDIADIEKTVLHEAVAHHGLRELFGDNFDNFLDTVFAKADIETRQQIAHLAAKHGWNVRTATEEYLASMAEDTNFEQIKPTLWQRIKQLFGEIMSAFGLHHANITDNDLRYILWHSYKNLQNSGKHSILDIAENIAMQYRLKVGNYTDKFTDELNAVNERFNEELSNLTEENADKVTLWLGKPSKVLLAAGVEDKPMKLYGNKVIRKMKKHGFSLEELRDLPRAVADPVAVFNNYQREGNRSILTELKTQQGNFLVSVNIGKDADINFNIVRSVFGKGNENVVAWINNGLATYINKEKALSFLSHQSAPIAATAANAGQESSSYLHLSAPIAEAAENSELSSAAKIIKDFHNPKLNSNVLYRSSIDPTATEVLPDARTRYEEETKEPDNIGSVPKTHNFFRRFYKSYIDSMLALKSFTNSVLEATGDKMASHEDTYKAENAMTSKNKTDGEVYNPLFPYMPLYLYM